MAIINYPNRIYKTKVPAIDRELARRNPITVSGGANILAAAIDETISVNSDWNLDSVAFTFSNASVKNYGVTVRNGRRVVTNYNDYLWFQMNGKSPQTITLDEGFYSGTELAAELQSKMDANASYIADGVTFTVVYDSTTGLFTITPSSGTIKYLNVNVRQTLRTRDSIAGHLFGFNVTTAAYGASITNDTEVFGLDAEAPIIDEVASADTDRYHDDIHTLSIDQAVRITTNSGVNVRVDWTAVYEVMV